MSFSVRGIPELQRRLKAIDKATGRSLLQQIQLDAVSNAKKTVPRKTGNLGRSIAGGSTTDRYTIVRARANYAAYVEFGTKGGQKIVPKKGKALAWPAAGSARLSGSAKRGGAMVFRRAVIRGATRAQPFLIPAARKSIEDNIGVTPIIRAWNKAA